MTAERLCGPGARPLRPHAATLLWVALAAPAPAELAVPELTGRTVDRAEVLSPATESALESLLAELERSTGAQLAVLTIPSLVGEPIESYALRVAETWGLGSRERDDGALLLVAVEDRRMRIEVSYGLEVDLPDAVAGRIIRQLMAPHFRRGDYGAGVLAGAQGIVDRLTTGTGEPARARPPDQQVAGPEAATTARSWDHFRLWVVFLLVMPIVGLVFALFAREAEARGIAFGALLLPIMLGGSLAADEIFVFPADSGAFLLGGVAALVLLSVLFWWAHFRLRKRPEVRERGRARLEEVVDGRMAVRAAQALGLPVPSEGGAARRWLRRSLVTVGYLAIGACIFRFWRPGYAIFYFHNLFWLFVIYRATFHPSPTSSSAGSWSGRSTRPRSPVRSTWGRSRSSTSGGFRPGGGSFGGGGASGGW